MPLLSTILHLTLFMGNDIVNCVYCIRFWRSIQQRYVRKDSGANFPLRSFYARKEIHPDKIGRRSSIKSALRWECIVRRYYR